MNVINSSRIKVAPLFCSLILTVPILTACMDVPKEEDDSEQQEEQVKEKEVKNTDSSTVENGELNKEETSSESDTEGLFTKEQQELIENMEEVSPEEAVKNAAGNRDKEELEALENRTDKLSEVAKFTDLDKFSAYVGELFFQYHTGKIGGKDFLTYAEPHFSETFTEQLPVDRNAQIKMFDTLQKLFADNLDSKIKSYIITKADGTPIEGEVVFYREYTLEDGSQMYYETTAKEVKGQWVLIDDVPTTDIKIKGQ